MKLKMTLKQPSVSRRAAAGRFGSRRRAVDIPTASLCVASTRLDEPSTTTTDLLPSAQRYISFSMSWMLSQQCVRAMCVDGRDQVIRRSLEWPCAYKCCGSRRLYCKSTRVIQCKVILERSVASALTPTALSQSSINTTFSYVTRGPPQHLTTTSTTQTSAVRQKARVETRRSSMVRPLVGRLDRRQVRPRVVRWSDDAARSTTLDADHKAQLLTTSSPTRRPIPSQKARAETLHMSLGGPRIAGANTNTERSRVERHGANAAVQMHAPLLRYGTSLKTRCGSV